MRIAVDILSCATGGPAQYILDFLPDLVSTARGDEIHVLASHPVLMQRLRQLQGFTTHDIPAGRRVASRLWWQWRSMPAWLRQHDIDVVFCPQGLTALAQGPPIVVLHQDSMLLCRERYDRSRTYAAAQRWFAHQTLRRAASALFVSESIRDLAAARGWLDGVATAVIPHGVRTDTLIAQTDTSRLDSLRREPPFILTVGSVMPHKNVHTLIQAVHVLRQRGRAPVRLLVAGEAPDHRRYARDIRDLIRKCNLAPHVELLGHLDRPVVAAHYQAARLYVSLSTLEAYGLTLVEAMGCGIPVICSRLPVFGDVCGEVAVRVNETDVGAVADAIESLWCDESRRAAMGAQGRSRAELFTWTRAAEMVLGALRQAAS